MENLDLIVHETNMGQGRIQPEVEGGAIWRGGAKKKMKSERAEGARKILGFVQ